MRTAAATIVFALGLLATMATAHAQSPAALVGNSSCATSTCHGNVAGYGPAWNHSLSTWIASDPHAGAGALLRDPRSRLIVNRLSPATIDNNEAFDNVLRTRCISCHANPTPDQCEPIGAIDDGLLQAGVSCEACHGAAGAWLEPHVLTSWTGPSRFEPATGMMDTESIIGRTDNCVRCHIGSRSADGLVRDMNHDIVAAGHPALRFDLLIYNENLPKHWSLDSEAEKEFNRSAVRTRAVSRSINLAAAASLSSERASAHLADPAVPWPEFADYDCFACHQSLSISEFSLPPRGKNKSPLHVSDGLPVWNSWHSVNQLELRDDRALLEKLSPHRSDPTLLANSGPALAKKYRQLARQRLAETPDAKEAARGVLAQLRESAPVDWHQAAVQYLEIDAALRDFTKTAPDSPQTVALVRLVRAAEAELRFDRPGPSGQAQPSAPEYDSPVRFDPESYRKAVLAALNSGPSQ